MRARFLPRRTCDYFGNSWKCFIFIVVDFLFSASAILTLAQYTMFTAREWKGSSGKTTENKNGHPFE